MKTKELIRDKLMIALKGNFEGKVLTKVDKIIKEGEKLFSIRIIAEDWMVFTKKREMKAMEKLDVLEGNLVLEVGSNGEDGNVFDLSKVEAKVQGTLKRSVKAGEEAALH